MPNITSFAETNERGYHKDEDYQRTYERSYVLTTDDYSIGPEWIAANIGVQLGQYYNTPSEFDKAAILNALDLTPVSADEYGQVWSLKVKYGPWSPYTHASNPLNLFPLVTMEGFNNQKLMDQDVRGNPILNTAYDPYTPAPEIDDARCVIRIQQNMATFSPSVILFYANKINTNIWFGMAPHCVKIDPPRGTVDFHQTCGNYWKVEWSFVVSPSVFINPSTGKPLIVGWDKYIANTGFRQLVSGSQEKILDNTGQPVDEPYFLDSTGTALNPPVAPADIIYSRYQVYQDIDFDSCIPISPTAFF